MISYRHEEIYKMRCTSQIAKFEVTFYTTGYLITMPICNTIIWTPNTDSGSCEIQDAT